MPLPDKRLVCLICLKKFTFKENDAGIQSNSTFKLSSHENSKVLYPSSGEPVSRKETSSSNNDTKDLYKRFLQFVSRYFKLQNLTDQFLEQVKSEDDKDALLETFCDNCGQLVSKVCSLYNELQTLQLFLVWKLGEMGDTLKSSSRPMTKNSSRKLLSSIAKQMNIKAGSNRQLLTFRKSLQLKCLNAAKFNGPFVALQKETIPDEWKCKFSYSATKQALIKLITVFTLSSKQLSSTKTISSTCATTSVTDDTKQLGIKRRPGRRRKRNTVKLAQGKPEKSTNQKTDVNEVASDTAAYHEDDNEETQDNFENDSTHDNPPSPISPAASDDDESHARCSLRRRRNILVKAEEDEEETISQESDRNDHYEIKINKKPGPKPIKSTCPKCSQIFPSRLEMWRHNRMVHNNNYKVKHKKNGGRRLKPGVKPTPSDCPKCSLNFPSRTELYRHLKVAHKKEPEIKIPRKKKRQRPFKHGPKSIPSDCSKCSKTFPSRTELNRHVAQMHKEKPGEAPCDEVIKREVDHDDDDDGMLENDTEEPDHLEIENTIQISRSGMKAEIKCPHCPKLFINRRGLSSHLQSAHRIYTEYPCTDCGMRFKKHKLLHKHRKKMHKYKTGRRSISSTCSKCSEVFPSRAELWWHQKKAHKVNRGLQRIPSTCPTCSEVFPSQTDLILHRKKLHRKNPGAKPVESTCNKCSKVFPSKNEMLLHMKNDHHRRYAYYGKPGRPKGRKDEEELKGINEQFICEVENCGESFELASILRQHLEGVHEAKESTKAIICTYCHLYSRKQFAYRQTYEMHVRTSHKFQVFGTYKCDMEACTVESFRSVEELNQHLKSHLEEPESKINEILFCEKCNWGFTRPEWRDLHQLCHISPGDDGKMDCPKCSERHGPNIKLLQSHFNKVHGMNIKPLKCDKCEMRFFRQKGLSKHKFDKHKISVQMSKVPSSKITLSREGYRCKLCETTCLDKNLLKAHMTREHPMFNKDLDGRQRDWCCELCGAQFTERHRLNTHMIRHGEPKFPCDVCGAKFKFKDRMQTHKKTMHDPNRSKSFICSECGNSFYSDMGLRFHFDSAHKPESEWDLKCPKCPCRFYRKLYLGIHLKTCDGNEEEEKKRLRNENETAGMKLSDDSLKAKQNEFQEDLPLSNSSIPQQAPSVQSNDPIQFDVQSTEILPKLPELQELQVTLSSLPPHSQNPQNQVFVAEQFDPMRNSPLKDADVQDVAKDQLNFEDTKGNNYLIENDDDQMPELDRAENGNDSDWSRGGTSPMSTTGHVSSDEDSDSEKNDSPGTLTRNLRKRHDVVVKVEEDDKEEENSREIDNLEKDPLFDSTSLSPPPPGPELKPEISEPSTSPSKLTPSSKFFPFVKIKRLENVEEMLKKNPTIFRKLQPKKSIKVLRKFKARAKRSENIECSQCTRKFTAQHCYRRHLMYKHKSNKTGTMTRKKDAWGKFKCDFESCKKKRAFHTMENLKKHLETHVKPGESEISFCEICNWGFMRPEVRDLHLLSHIPVNDKGEIPCSQCRVSYRSICYLQMHFNRVHGANLKFFKCDKCDDGFLLRHSFMHHRRTAHFQHGTSDLKKLKCEECDLNFDNATLFGKHIQNYHDPGQRFTCSEQGCSELKFSTRRKLNTHITQKHVGSEGRHWICDLCGAKFTKKATLEKHIDNHGGAKWPCEVCGVMFKRKNRVKEHIERIHNPGRLQNWICSECGKSYFTEMGLQYHFDSAHKTESEWKLKCPKCPRRFYRKLFLDLHLKKCNGSQNEDKIEETAEFDQKGLNDTGKSSSNVNTVEDTSTKLATSEQLQQKGLVDISIPQPPVSQCNPGQFSSQPYMTSSPVSFQSSPPQVGPGLQELQGLPGLAFPGALPQYQNRFGQQIHEQQYNQFLQSDTGIPPPGPEASANHSPS